MGIQLRQCLIALLLAHFASLQWFVAVHRIAHFGHGSTHLAHADAHDHDPESDHADSGHGIGVEHHSQLDCDRFDTCTAADIPLSDVGAAPRFEELSLAPNRTEDATVTTRALRAKARGPPARLS